MTFKTAGGVMTKQVTYRYDVYDRRIAKDVDDDGDGTVDRGEWYVYDGDRILFRTDRGGSITNRYLHGPQVDQLFSDESTVDGLLWALADHQGTVRDWADFASGTNTTTVANHLKYDAFGSITSQSSGTHEPLFAYTGREWDADAELYYYRARWYDPGAGRFVSEDRVGFTAGDANLGRYVGNSPTNFVDPSGLTADDSASYLLPGQTYEEYWASMYAALLLVPRTDGIVQGFDWLDRNFGGDFYGGPDASGQIIAGIGTLASFAPIAGEIGDAGQLLLGRDFNGNALTATDQALMAGGLALPLVPGSLLSKTDDVVRAVPPLGGCFVAVVGRRPKRQTEKLVRRGRRYGASLPKGHFRVVDDHGRYVAGADDDSRDGDGIGMAETVSPPAQPRTSSAAATIAPPLRRRTSFTPWLIGCAAAALFAFLCQGLEPGSPTSQPTQAVPAISAAGPAVRPIESLRVGDIVRTETPHAEDDRRLGKSIDPPRWRSLALRAPKVDGSWADVTLLRPLSWLEGHAATVGGTVRITVPECGIDGNATVLAIGLCPDVPEPTPGHAVVTGTYRHASADVLDLTIDGVADPIGVTGVHPFWSEDRRAFVRADSLAVGERVLALSGPAAVTAITRRGSPEPVYNLEVMREHVYRVGTAGVLVHNGNCPTPAIIGETMRRVEEAARQFPGAKILDDIPDFPSMGMTDYEVTSAMMQYNRKWLLEQMRSGRPIIDIGPDPLRGTPSIFYQMERRMLDNYRKLHAGSPQPLGL